MPARRDEAFVLARYPYRERDLVVTLLAREGGLVRALARRARGVRSRLAAVLEPLARIRVSYFERPRSELASLDEAVLVASSFPLAEAPRAWVAGHVVAELAMVYCPPGEAADAPFRLVDHCLGALREGAAPRTAAAYAHLWFLRLAGVFPDVASCGECGRPLTGPAVWEESLSVLLCPSHRPRATFLAADAVAWLQDASRSRLAGLVPPPAAALPWLATLQREFSGRELKSLQALERLAAVRRAGE